MCSVCIILTFNLYYKNRVDLRLNELVVGNCNVSDAKFLRYCYTTQDNTIIIVMNIPRGRNTKSKSNIENKNGRSAVVACSKHRHTQNKTQTF